MAKNKSSGSSTLHQQIVHDRLIDAASRLNLRQDLPAAFIRYAHALVLGSSLLTLDRQDIVDAREVTDGGQEKQIDAFTIRESDQDATVFITQTKLGASFSSNDIVLLKNGLSWCFEKGGDELKSLKNLRLRKRIEELWISLKQVGPSRLRVVVSYITTGSTDHLSDEFAQERAALERYLSGLGFSDTSVQVWGAAELVQRADEIDREGCQTASVLAAAQANGKLAANTRVLVRAYQAVTPGLIDDIVESTNTQNKITTRNLKANDRLQIEMQQAFRTKGFFYERKPRQFDNELAATAETLMSNEEVGQGYLAVVMKQPSNAGRRKYLIWDEMYKQVFGGSIVEPYIVATLLTRAVREWLDGSALHYSRSELKKKLASRAAYHIARVLSFQWARGDSWVRDAAQATTFLENLKGRKRITSAQFQRAFDTVYTTIARFKEFKSDLDLSLRSAALDEALDRALYRSRASTKKKSVTG
ncbi:MAG: AIPR family protein [Anaerolineae bacterium]|nr:AIPR family protein [Phycisphaerae bacterium]